jgi:putative SbcD/Mre11-related phosphoesterase
MKATPLYGKNALFVPSLKAIVIADLHIGIEYELSLIGANIPSQTQSLLEKCQKLGREKDVDKFILLGDVKHLITPLGEKNEYLYALRMERRDVNFFLTALAQEFDVWIIKGNHDGGLKSTTENITIFDSKGMCKGGIGFAHGHAWPSKEVMKCDVLVTAHTHPVVRILNALGNITTKPCWVRGPVLAEKISERYGVIRKKMEFIITPAFNALCGGTPVNKEGVLGPLGKVFDIQNAHIYLLDASYLGRIQDL